MNSARVETRPHWLDRPVGLGQFNREQALYLLLIALAIFTRFGNLGDRVMSHDESEHVYFSWLLYKGGGYVHSPITHGPFLFHITALIFSFFGDTDFTARISVALFGVVRVAFPYLLRPWLGRAGALVTSFMLLISPSILYHDRYIRDEAYLLVWAMLIVLALFSYWRTRSSWWLYVLSGTLAFMYITMEAAYIFAVIFGVFLVGVLLAELAARKDCGRKQFLKVIVGLAGAAAIALGSLIIQTVILEATGLGPSARSPFPSPLTPVQPGLPIEISARIQFGLQTLGAILQIGLSILIPAALIGVGTYKWLKAVWPDQLRTSAAFDLALVIFTLSLFMLPAGALLILNPLWLRLFNAPFVDVAFFASGSFPTDDVGSVLRLAAVLGAFTAVAAALGWWWDRRRWVICSGIFVAIGLIFFTTVFTNGVGLGSGFIGSLGYWLQQQAVQRGSQPLYYYLVVTPLYEYLPILASAAALIFYSVGWLRGRRLKTGRPIAWDQRLFIPFAIWWSIASWVAYSYAGERMPWLMVYLALPMIVLSGRFLGERLEKIDWPAFVRDRHWLLAILLMVAVVAGAEVVGNLQSALGGLALDGLAAFLNWLGALLVCVLALWGLFRLTPRPDRSTLLRTLGLMVLLVLTGLTIRTAWMFNFIHADSALEFGVYAHGGPGVKVAMKQIDELAQRRGESQPIEIVLDSDATWPFNWYLRDYTSHIIPADMPSRADLEAPVIIASAQNWATIESVLGQTYMQAQYHRIWWPMEDYKTLAEYSLNRTPRVLWNWLTDPQRRTALLDIFFNRDYARYDQIRGTTHTLNNWPIAQDFRLYLRREDQSATTSVDPYATGWRDIAAVQVWGSIGSEPGQLLAPHGIALAPDGSIYVADSLNHRVVKFDQQGQFVMTIGGPSGANGANPQPGLFNEPWGVAAAPDNSVYVADTWNHRIQQFTPDGALLQAWGVNADTVGTAVGNEGGFFGPRGIAVDANGRVIVADTGNKRVQIFAATGKFVAQFGGSGLQPGRLDEPVGVAVDLKGNIVVADTWNGRVQVFDPSGQPTASWNVDGWSDKVGVGKPYLAVDQQQRVYLADEVSRRVLVFEMAGNYLGSFGGYGTDERGFVAPGGIAVDRSGNIYVVDTGLARVLKFPPF